MLVLGHGLLWSPTHISIKAYRYRLDILKTIAIMTSQTQNFLIF